jgi:hypothetical protein
MGRSRRDFHERSMSRQTRETTVVSQPPRFSRVAVSGAVEAQPGIDAQRNGAERD